jgi:hypothetical protein
LAAPRCCQLKAARILNGVTRVGDSSPPSVPGALAHGLCSCLGLAVGDHLSRLTGLTSLSLHNCMKIGPACISRIASRQRRLQQLNLRGCAHLTGGRRIAAPRLALPLAWLKLANSIA